MKTKRKSYALVEDNRTLIHEESYDEKGNVVQSISYDETPSIERNLEYNSKGQLMYQNEIQGGIENSAQYFEYNDEGEIIDQKLKIGGELYEHIVLSITETGSTRTMTQDGEEVERLESHKDGANWSKKFYQYSELLQSQDYTYDATDNSGEVKLKSFEGDFEMIIKTKYNAEKATILDERFHENGTLIISTATEFENGLKVKETVKDFSIGESYFMRHFEYDENKNVINFEVRSSTEALCSFHWRTFDDKNRLIEEAGFTNGYFSGISGIHRNHDRFHILHEYEVVN